MIPRSIGIMQPYLFPYLGYFSLIKHTENWVVFDTVQYINKGWINRNKILKQGGDNIGYITVPVNKISREMIIKDVMIDHSQKWKEKIKGQLSFYKKKAPFYNATIEIVDKVLNYNTDKINELNVFALRQVCQYLNLPFNYTLFSENTMQIEKVNEPDEWALEITKKADAKIYINPPGGRDFFNISKYSDANIDLRFLSIILEEYDNFLKSPILGLSIIDVMMFNTPERINEMLDNYEYV